MLAESNPIEVTKPNQSNDIEIVEINISDYVDIGINGNFTSELEGNKVISKVEHLFILQELQHHCEDCGRKYKYIVNGMVDNLMIKYETLFDLDLSKLICNDLIYINQKDDSIKNHILPKKFRSLKLNENNSITELPILHKSFMCYLDCSNNKIKNLPKLPKRLSVLKCDNNLIENLPNRLPYHLTQLYCNNNKLTKFPNKIFGRLRKIECRENNFQEPIYIPNKKGKDKVRINVNKKVNMIFKINHRKLYC